MSSISSPLRSVLKSNKVTIKKKNLSTILKVSKFLSDSLLQLAYLSLHKHLCINKYDCGTQCKHKWKIIFLLVIAVLGAPLFLAPGYLEALFG